MGITIKTPEEIVILREGGKRLAAVLAEVVSRAQDGMSTWELDQLAEELIFAQGGKPSFKGYRIKDARSAYPATLCTSVNDEVVHSIPRRDRILQNGDIVGIDIGMWYPADAIANDQQPTINKRHKKLEVDDGKSGVYHERLSLVTDMAVTIGIGEISEEAGRLLKVTKEALAIGIGAVKPGARVGNVSYAIQTYLDKHGLGIVRGLAGHGVGYELHEEPLIPNYGQPNTGPELREGMVVAIEPMATLGGDDVVLGDDEWTFRTADGSIAAHFEHSMVITMDGAEILTK